MLQHFLWVVPTDALGTTTEQQKDKNALAQCETVEKKTGKKDTFTFFSFCLGLMPDTVRTVLEDSRMDPRGSRFGEAAAR